jgi:hypothetical protein
MPVSDGRNRPAAAAAVESAGDDRHVAGDKRGGEVTRGRWRGVSGRLLSGYGWVALLILATCVVNVLTAMQHDGGASNLARPILDEASSAAVLIALLPILKRSVDALATPSDRRIAFIVMALAIIAYGLLHVVLMFALRELAYPAIGAHLDFRWREKFPTEFRKDVISAFMIAVVFWLIDRRSSAAGSDVAPAQPTTEPHNIWLKDGTTAVRVDPADVISVTSAGNYVEFSLAQQRHLVRGTLAAEETRLKPFGFARIRRTRLVNANHIVAIEQHTNGDFALRMDTGVVIAGSRRYRDALVAIKAAGRSGA